MNLVNQQPSANTLPTYQNVLSYQLSILTHLPNISPPILRDKLFAVLAFFLVAEINILVAFPAMKPILQSSILMLMR